MNTVSVYSTQGWIEDLPDLLTGRQSHGCGQFVNSDNEMVSIFLNTYCLYLIHCHYCQVYLVTGGKGSRDNIVSTEILVAGSDSWTQVGDLPTVPINYL